MKERPIINFMEEKRKAQGCFRAGVPRPWRYKGGREAAQDRYRKAHAEEIRERKRVAYQNNKDANRKRSADWRKKNPEKWMQMMRESNQRLRERLRIEMLKQYGNKCACCGEDEPLFLELDHANNNGAEDRKVNGSGVKLLGRLKKRDGLKVSINFYVVIVIKENGGIMAYVHTKRKANNFRRRHGTSDPGRQEDSNTQGDKAPKF